MGKMLKKILYNPIAQGLVRAIPHGMEVGGILLLAGAAIDYENMNFYWAGAASYIIGREMNNWFNRQTHPSKESKLPEITQAK